MRNIILIGMPGAGKSTVGVLLAKALGMSFIDADLIIQQNTGNLLQEIIDKYSISKFLEIEESIILSLNIENSVVATGGSIIYSRNAINSLKRNGILIYLKLPYDEIERRISNIKTRGIVIGKDQKLMDIYNERIPLYEKYADIIIDCTGKNMEDIIIAVKSALKI